MSDINTGLSPARPYTMLALLGKPGNLTRDCSAITNRILHAHIVTHHFNHFSVTGWKPAIDCLVGAMTDCYHEQPELHSVIRTAGMLCCRAVRGSTSTLSIHSWGCAADMQIENQLDPLGATVVQRGILMLYPYMHRHGFFWGAGYKGRKDPQHFEIADETVRRLYRQYYG
jgi:hypothetical protein